MSRFPRILIGLSCCVVLLTGITLRAVYAESIPASLPLPSQTPAPTPDPALAKIEAVRVASREANTAMSTVEERRLTASSTTAALADKCTSTDISEQTAIEFTQLTERTIAASQPSLPTSLTDAETKLRAAETKLKTAKSGLPTAEPLSADVIQANADAQGTLDEITRQLTALNDERTKLNAVLPRGLTCAQGLISTMSEKLGPLKNLNAATKGDASLPVLNQSIPDLITVITVKQRVSALWGAKQTTGGLMRALAALGKTEAELTPVTTGLATLDTDVKDIGVKLKTLLPALADYAESKRVRMGQLSKDVVLEPALNAEPAQSELKLGMRLSAQLAQLNSALGLLEAQLGNFVSVTDQQDISDADAALVEKARRLGVAANLLQDALGGSFEKFEADQVSLFYFTDVPRLMQALNPATFEHGGIRDARERAEQVRRDLAESELTLANAQGSVNTHQRRLEDLREELRQARSEFLALDSRLLTSGRRLEELKARPEPDQRRITRSEQEKGDLQAQRDAAKEREEELSNEQNGLPAKIREARNDLIKAQEKVREARSNILRLALAESEAFARARDNAPFWVAMPIASSSDPAKRVLMYAFNDSKTLFLRGNVEDLVKVREIIDRFDRPAPQARMTLWTLELNSTADKAGSKQFNKALATIENELSNTRARIATSLSTLRECINKEVNRVARTKLDQSGVPPDETSLRWARLHFYQMEVLLRLGFNPQNTRPTGSQDVARFALPDPAATTTLGEALMVLSLANAVSRGNIAKDFTDHIETEINELDSSNTGNHKRNDNPHLLNARQARFAFMRRVMGLDITSADARDISSAQEEIIRAIQAAAVENVVRHLRKLADELNGVAIEFHDALEFTDPAGVAGREKTVALADKRKVYKAKERAILDAMNTRQNIVNEIIPLQAWLRNQMGIRTRIPAGGRVIDLPDFNPQGLSVDAGIQVYDQALAELNTAAKLAFEEFKNSQSAVESAITQVEKINPLRTANARVAAADQMLKEMIIAVEDDLDRHFVQQMMIRLREGLVKDYKGIGVGIVQRTSVLASNRTLARVDARGSAQIALGQETDILQGVQQIANLIMAGQTAGPLGILGGLNALPRRDSTELYGLTTGGTFKVTPIFDPSGQALRFQLDQVSATMIREPDGTVNPQLPRVERHTVNTEVQLSNMELREVSRFNANARLGLPTRTWGGLPIFNSFPWIRRNVPLFGWFVRKSGDAPFVQQSLIFGQTTMYPTIGDIVELLRNPDAPK